MSKEKALADVERMADEAGEILSALELIRSGIKTNNNAHVQSGLDVLHDNTYGYVGGIIGFSSRTANIADLIGIV